MKYKLFFLFFTFFLLISNVLGYEKSIIDVTNTNILEIQNYIDEGYITYEELMTLYLERIEVYNSMYNALISINEQALEQARECDRIYKEQGRSSLLFGIPIILKDNIDYTDLPTTIGTKALRDSYPLENATIVENLIEQGAIIIGKANMSEFAFTAGHSYSSYGHVRNAYNLDYTPYGSSGGSAVAVAASFAPLAIGTDTSSSVRLPAGANNIIGFRPTKGLLSNDGIVAYDIIRDTAGPMSQNVSDNAILMTALASNDIDYTKYLDKDGLNNKKIGVLTQFIKKQNSSIYALNSYYNEIDYLMQQAILKMQEAGAEIVYIDDFYNEEMESYYLRTMAGYTLCYEFNNYIQNTTSSIKNFTDLLNNGGFIQPLSPYKLSCNYNLKEKKEYQKILDLQATYREIVSNIMHNYDVDILVYPSTKNKLYTLKEAQNKEVSSISYTIAPTTGFPAISLPLGFDSYGLPYGFEMLAKANEEGLLYEAAYAYESLTDGFMGPSIAPSLYEIPEELIDLKLFFETHKLSLYEKMFVVFDKSYIDAYNILHDYIDYQGSSDELQSVYNKYKFLFVDKKIPEFKVNSDNIIYIYGYMFICLLLSVFIVLFMLLKRKKIDKNNEKA